MTSHSFLRAVLALIALTWLGIIVATMTVLQSCLNVHEKSARTTFGVGDAGGGRDASTNATTTTVAPTDSLIRTPPLPDVPAHGSAIQGKLILPVIRELVSEQPEHERPPLHSPAPDGAWPSLSVLVPVCNLRSPWFPTMYAMFAHQDYQGELELRILDGECSRSPVAKE